MRGMPFWMRVAFGVLLGAGALVALWLLVGITWVTALVAGLLAPIGFLGSFFVVSADRPEEGYEQVLFDRPNTVVSGVLLVALAVAGMGTGFLGGAEASSSTADRVAMLRADYQRTADALSAEDADAEAALASIDELRLESDRLAMEIEELPEGRERDALSKANDALAFALDSLKACAEGDREECVNARFSAADAQSALERLAADE